MDKVTFELIVKFVSYSNDILDYGTFKGKIQIQEYVFPYLLH